MSDEVGKLLEIQKGARAALALQILGEELSAVEAAAVAELRMQFASGASPETFTKGVATLSVVGELKERFAGYVNLGRQHDPVIKEE
jgi:hypothetical protein